MSNDVIDIRPLKDLALKLSSDHPLRIVLMLEDDWLPPRAFLVKVGMWLRLLKLEAVAL